MPTTPSKEVQAAEGSARENAGNTIPAGETAIATAGTENDPGPQDLGTRETSAPAAAAAEAPAPRELPPARSMGDDKRNAITKRFRTERTADTTDNTDAVSEFARDGGIPADFKAAAEPEGGIEGEPVAAVIEAAPAALPQKVKIKVRGEEREVPLEEVLAQAQIAYAADSYLDEAKGKLKQADTVLRDIEQRASRPAQDGIHPADPNATHAAPLQPNGDPQHPEDPADRLIETMQFGDPEEAKQLLRNTIATEAGKAANQAIAQSRLEQEDARGATVLKAFSDSHPELAQDPMARAAIEAKIYELQIDDITKLGIDPSKLRTDGRPATPADIAFAHRNLRSRNYAVRNPEQMLKDASDGFLAWKGVTANKPADPAPDPAPPAAQRKAATNLEVVVDRTVRKSTIPQQPSRTTAPRTDQQQAPQPRSRADIVAAEKQRRAALRGAVLA
jgi:hypothetical protein